MERDQDGQLHEIISEGRQGKMFRFERCYTPYPSVRREFIVSRQCK